MTNKKVFDKSKDILTNKLLTKLSVKTSNSAAPVANIRLAPSLNELV